MIIILIELLIHLCMYAFVYLRLSLLIILSSLLRVQCPSFMMNFSEEILLLFRCNVSPSETPQLDISVTKSEPLRIAIPMTIFYGIIFLFGVWVLKLLDTSSGCL